MPCVLTIVALGILPYVTLTVPQSSRLPVPVTFVSGVPRRLHLAQLLLQLADFVPDPGRNFEL